MKDRQTAKNFALIADATPVSSHVEQTTSLVRYVIQKGSHFDFVKRFLNFVDCSDKSGHDIAQMIVASLQEHDIPLSDCRAHAYDNGANMAEKYNGAESKFLE